MACTIIPVFYGFIACSFRLLAYKGLSYLNFVLFYFSAGYTNIIDNPTTTVTKVSFFNKLCLNAGALNLNDVRVCFIM